MTTVVVLLSGLAAALVAGGGESPQVGRVPFSVVRGSRALGVAAVGLVVCAVAWSGPGRAVLAVILGGIGWATAGLVGRSRRLRLADARRARVVDCCEALAGDLAAGLPAPVALGYAARAWNTLAPVAAAAELGADVPAALRRAASQGGAEGLREVASAWQVSERSGTALAHVLGQVASTARAQQSTRGLVSAELASARATARIVAGLPLVALGMASGVGAHPWHFLLGTPLGLGCLAAGAVSAFTGLLWIDRIAAGVLAR